MTSTAIVAYLVLFAAVAFLFVLASLLLGKFLRPASPTPQKVETYECGEPAVGSGFGQFDLRFYVVALLFLIFEVEVAFFFPPATVFGKACKLQDPNYSKVGVVHSHARTGSSLNGSFLRLTPDVEKTYRELGIAESLILQSDASGHGIPANKEAVRSSTEAIEKQALTLARTAMLDLGVFFAVLLVGFAYIWRCGDLNWVRAVGHPRSAAEDASMLRQLRSDNGP
jgi:NADH-quinone oxidoreductase subunit A